MVAGPRRFFILDASVVIDLSHVDRRVLAEVCRAAGTVLVARPMLDAVDHFDEATASTVGFALIEPDLADLVEVARERRGALSSHDKLCLRLARRNGWTCVSNDKLLRGECTNRGVPVLSGLDMLAL